MAADANAPACGGSNTSVKVTGNVGNREFTVGTKLSYGATTMGFQEYGSGMSNLGYAFSNKAEDAGSATIDGIGSGWNSIKDYCVTIDGHLMVTVNGAYGKFQIEALDHGVFRYFLPTGTYAKTPNYYNAKYSDATGNGVILPGIGDPNSNPSSGRVYLRNPVNASFSKISPNHIVTAVDSSKPASYDAIPMSPTSRGLVLDSNGGAWSDGSKTMFQVISTNYKPVTDDRPTRDGYILDSWNTKPDGTGDDVSVLKTGLKDGQTVYAVWRKDPGKPRNVQLDCSPRKAGGVLCSVMAYYGSNAPVQTRELTTTGTNQLAWAGDPIAGVNLDRNGYAADMSCTTRGDGDSQCYYASLASAPADSNTTVVTQTPVTGAPASNYLIPAVLAAMGLAGVAYGVRSRRQTRR